VEQLPVIKEALRSIKERIEAATADACALVCSEETVQSVKTTRADLRKQFDALDAQRKKVKAQILTPYEDFEQTFKECVTVPFKAADYALAEKIRDVEGQQKAECEARCRAYFEELKAIHNVPFLKYEDAGIRISLSEAKKSKPTKHYDEMNVFCAKVATDIAGIRKMETCEEVMAEYMKQHYDLGLAIRVVRDRHEEIERAKFEAARIADMAKKQEEAVQKVEDAAAILEPPKEEPEQPEEPVFERFTFTVLGATKSQLIKVREFMKQEGIKYE